jgi:hypothetical protein
VREYIKYDVPPISHDQVDGIYRLLILDGFTGHGAFASREYCAKFNIIIAPLPPHSANISITPNWLFRLNNWHTEVSRCHGLTLESSH